jgi:hypothetical protein
MATVSPERRPNSTKDAVSEDDTMDLEKKRRERKPFFYCRIVAKYPVKSFGKCLVSVQAPNNPPYTL